MGWSDWPYWLRGGIVGVIILVVVFLGWLLWGLTQPRSDLWGLAIIGGLFYGAIALVPVFVVGAVIGLIIQKIKS